MRYRPPRSPAHRPVTLILPDGTEPAILRSVSTTGARIECDTALAPGTRLHLTIQGKRWAARAVWWEEGEAGVAFARPLSQAELGAIRDQGGVSGRVHGQGAARNHHGFRELR